MNPRHRPRLTILILILLCAAGCALAQPPASPDGATRIDLTELLVSLLQVAFPLLTAIATYLINRRVKDQQLAGMLSNAVQNAVGVVQRNLTDGLRATPVMIDVRDPAVAAGVNYIKQNAQEAISHFKIPDERLTEKILAKLGLVQLASEVPAAPAPVGKAMPLLGRSPS